MTRSKATPRRRPAIETLVSNPVYRALNRAPLSGSQQTDLALAARLAFECTRRGQASEADRDTLACMVNVSLVLSERHCSPVEVEVTKLTQEALLRADGRALEGLRWGLDGQGLQAITAILDMHEQQIALVGREAVAGAVLEVRARMARGQVHQVVLKEASK